jgi:hypothetical protein
MTGNIDWISVFDDIVQYISLDRAFAVEQKELACTSGSWMEPTVYRLLAIRPLRNGSQSEHEMEEICRLGTLLFLAPFWRALGQNPVWTAAISRNLFFLLGRNHIAWGQLNPLLSWMLYFAAIETQNHVERSHFVSMLSAVLESMNLEEWDEIMRIVQGVLWAENVFAGSDRLIRDQVMRAMNYNSVAHGLFEAAPALVE